METSEHSKRARVLFDEAHSESWSIRAEVAERMQASHPADASLASAAEALERRDFEVRANATAPIDGGLLASTDVLVIAHPSEPQWEATTGEGEPRLTDAEIEAIAAWVEAGGGLIVLGETEQEKYGNNLNELLGRFGIEIENTTVQDYEHHRGEAPSWILADLVESPDAAGADPLAGVTDACFYRAGTLALSNGARVIARTSPSAAPPTAPLAAVTRYGAGRVVVLADSDLFGDDCIDELDHESFWVNLAYFAAEPAFGAAGERVESAAAADPAWHAGFATRSRSCGPTRPRTARSTPPAPIEARLRELVAAIKEGSEALLRHFPHQGDYIAALGEDLDQWAGSGFGAPDFLRSIEAFRPERDRRDGIEHLVVFPMYKQNGSPDTCFEALIVRVPWPRWAVELESRYDNAKFLPVEFVDYTSGYDSECAVLFPETFSAADRPRPTSARSSATARRSACAGSAAAPPRSCG